MATTNLGPRNWWMETDAQGYREYHIVYLVSTSSPYYWTSGGDGPKIASETSGLPTVGDYWVFGNDVDYWAVCWPNRIVRPYGLNKEGEAVKFYTVECLFSTKPFCADFVTDNPLLQPQRVSGSTTRFTIEAAKDRNGNLIRTSSHEMIRGPQVEFDSSRPAVRVEQNVADLELALCTSMMDHVNDDVLWGLAARRIKLSNFTWEELWYGQCFHYYKRIFDFDVRNNPDDLFDRWVLDEGTKVLNGRWTKSAQFGTGTCGPDLWEEVALGCETGTGPDPDPDNPQHFIRYKDRNDENCRVMLNGSGRPANTKQLIQISQTGEMGTTNTGDIAEIKIEYYPEANLTLLGIPTSLSYGTASS